MTKDKKKKLGLQKNVMSIFKGVPIPQKNAGDKTRQTPNAPEPGCTNNIPTQEQTIDSSFEPQCNSDIPVPEHTVNTSEPEYVANAAPEQTGNTPAKPNFQEQQKSKLSLIKKINQPTQLLRNDNPYKDLLIDADKKVAKPGLWQRIKDKLFATKPGKSSARQKITVLMIPVLASVFIFVLRQVF